MTLSYLDRRNIHTTPWDDERDALLARLWAEGYSASQIADRITDVHVTRCAVIGRVHRLQLPARKERQPAIRKPAGRKPASRPQPPPPPTMRLLPLSKLGEATCHFPINDGGPFLFCGADAANGEIYCRFHRGLATREGKLNV